MARWVWPFGVTWRHRSCDHSTRHVPFPIGGPWELSSISNGFRDIQWRMRQCDAIVWHDLKRPLCKKSKSLIGTQQLWVRFEPATSWSQVPALYTTQPIGTSCLRRKQNKTQAVNIEDSKIQRVRNTEESYPWPMTWPDPTQISDQLTDGICNMCDSAYTFIVKQCGGAVWEVERVESVGIVGHVHVSEAYVGEFLTERQLPISGRLSTRATRRAVISQDTDVATRSQTNHSTDTQTDRHTDSQTNIHGPDGLFAAKPRLSRRRRRRLSKIFAAGGRLSRRIIGLSSDLLTGSTAQD